MWHAWRWRSWPRSALPPAPTSTETAGWSASTSPSPSSRLPFPTARRPTMVAGASEATGDAPVRRDYGPIQLAGRPGLRAWQVDRVRTLGLVPAPDLDGRRWSAALVEPLADRVPEVLAAVGEHPGVGANRAAEQLTERSGIAGVHRSDVE